MRCLHRRQSKRCFAHLLVVSLVALILLLVARLPDAPADNDKASQLVLSKLAGPRPKLVAILHQSWTTNVLPPLFKHWSASFKHCLPNFRRILWTDADNRNLVARHYPWFLARFDSLAPGVQRADAARLLYMHKYGGVYCDLDCECLNDFRHLLANTSLALGAMNGSLVYDREDPAFVEEGQVENSFMYSQPGHPFFWDLIVRLNATQGDQPIMTTGTYLVMSGIKAARQAGLDRTKFRGLPYLTVYPPSLFNPFSWIGQARVKDCQPFGKFTAKSLRSCRQAYSKTSYIVQYHTQVWDKGRGNVLHRGAQDW